MRLTDRDQAQVAFDDCAGAFDMGDPCRVLKGECAARVAGLCSESVAGNGLLIMKEVLYASHDQDR